MNTCRERVACSSRTLYSPCLSRMLTVVKQLRKIKLVFDGSAKKRSNIDKNYDQA